MSDAVKLRPELAAFAEQMERALRRKDDTRGDSWRGESYDWLLQRLTEEVGELTQELMDQSMPRARRIEAEAVDVANFALFIASVAAGRASRSHFCLDCGARVTPPEMEAKQLPRCATCRWARSLSDDARLECVRQNESGSLLGAGIVTDTHLAVAEGAASVIVSPLFGCVMWEAKP